MDKFDLSTPEKRQSFLTNYRTATVTYPDGETRNYELVEVNKKGIVALKSLEGILHFYIHSPRVDPIPYFENGCEPDGYIEPKFA